MGNDGECVRVLVVDDDPELLFVLVRLVEERAKDVGVKTEVWTAASVEAALMYSLGDFAGVICDGLFGESGVVGGAWLQVAEKALEHGRRFALFTGDHEEFEYGREVFKTLRSGLGRAFEKPMDSLAAVEWALNGVEFP